MTWAILTLLIQGSKVLGEQYSRASVNCLLHLTVVPQERKIGEVKPNIYPCSRGEEEPRGPLFGARYFPVGHMQGLAMKGLTVAVFVWTLISPSSGSKAWPPHTVCRNGNLEVLYQSCGKVFQNVLFCVYGEMEALR